MGKGIRKDFKTHEEWQEAKKNKWTLKKHIKNKQDIMEEKKRSGK